MNKIRLKESIEGTMFGCGTKFSIQKDIDYICESQQVGSLATLVDGNLEVEKISVGKRFGSNPSSILIIRAGGAGDILFLTPVLAQLRKQFPTAYICVAISARYHWVLRGNKNVDGYSDFPMKLGLVGRYDWVIDLENMVEDCVDKHAITSFADRCGITIEDMRTTYLPEVPASVFESQFPKTIRRVGIQKSASTPVRTYPRILELQGKLRAAGWEVAIFSSPGELAFPVPIPGLINVGELGWTWSRSTDFLQTCDFIIGPDSSLIHFAGALGIPGIGIYGSFTAKHRLIEGGSIQAMQTNAECPLAPCHHHGRRSLVFPQDGPCNKAKLCAPLATISPEMVLDKMASMGF